ncbi:MAG: hypothetical protein ACSHWS_00685 [Sulfitobacter sp.]
MRPPDDVAVRLAALPVGTSTGTAHGTRYVVTRSLFNYGRSTKLVAEELGGNDYISLNFYDLAAGPSLYPCEMAAEKVIAFLRDFTPDQTLDAAP